MGFIAHRPWPLPARPWVVAQRWTDLVFAHWPIDLDRLAPHIPDGLTLDRYEDTAWVSMTAFLLSGLRLRGWPPLPWLSSFPELNFRTYVTRDGKPGVLFFSLDAGRSLAVLGARLGYHLPYFGAAMHVTMAPDGRIDYRSRRADSDRPAEFQASYRPMTHVSPRPAVPGTLDHWLTERYCLYATGSGRLYRAEIHHAPWRLQPVEFDIGWNTVPTAAGIVLPSQPARTAYAARLDVVVWWPVRLRLTSGRRRPSDRVPTPKTDDGAMNA
jgi:uncharacterized protein YqjF (DUF2071 family)